MTENTQKEENVKGFTSYVKVNKHLLFEKPAYSKVPCQKCSGIIFYEIFDSNIWKISKHSIRFKGLDATEDSFDFSPVFLNGKPFLFICIIAVTQSLARRENQ